MLLAIHDARDTATRRRRLALFYASRASEAALDALSAELRAATLADSIAFVEGDRALRAIDAALASEIDEDTTQDHSEPFGPGGWG